MCPEADIRRCGVPAASPGIPTLAERDLAAARELLQRQEHARSTRETLQVDLRRQRPGVGRRLDAQSLPMPSLHR